jgi:hypothetical protein
MLTTQILLSGYRVPDLDLVTSTGSSSLLYDARPVLLNLSVPGGFGGTPWRIAVR